CTITAATKAIIFYDAPYHVVRYRARPEPRLAHAPGAAYDSTRFSQPTREAQLASLSRHFPALTDDTVARTRPDTRAVGGALVSLWVSGHLDRAAWVRGLRCRTRLVAVAARARHAGSHAGVARPAVRCADRRRLLAAAAHSV